MEYTFQSIKSAQFRDLRKISQDLNLQVADVSTMRQNIMNKLGLSPPPRAPRQQKKKDPNGDGEGGIQIKGFERRPESGGDIQATLEAIEMCAETKEWKTATRKLKQLTNACASTSPATPVPPSAYTSALLSMSDNYGSCTPHAVSPARSIIETCLKSDVPLPADLLNRYAQSATYLSRDPQSIDSTLAIMQAMSSANVPIESQTYVLAIQRLCDEKCVSEATLVLRSWIVEGGETPELRVFEQVAREAVIQEEWEGVMSVLSLTKAAGYELDTIGTASSGRSLLGLGVIASEKLDNTPLALRLLTAANKADVSPERGDSLTCQTSKDVFNSALKIHSKAISDAEKEGNWKLAVKILELMKLRSLRPNSYTWLRVLRLCLSQKKSRRATAILFDWITESSNSKTGVEPPEISSFNSVVNCCELCGETELTLAVIEKMRQVHGTEGNVITFNIALKRLAKSGNGLACEGIILGMLQNQIEPTVVSYTTAIGAAASVGDYKMAKEWIRRMRIRHCYPNYHTYNCALSACVESKSLAGVEAGVEISKLYLADAGEQLRACDPEANGEEQKFFTTIPDKYGRQLAKQLTNELRECWRRGEIDMEEAKGGLRAELYKLVDFNDAKIEEMKGKIGEDEVECLEWHHLPKREVV
ncbi:hypothetical protein TrVE_jg1831 [Triparma verrucosa]|uniref:Pentatricopeptide repeat-containing protein n=1 Tax=Triparma verrucosa TaxID=1606542 RepID=A0A9W7C0D7_9STRA|nr:hypothetical protein TrVE_jg1831 [Triparma verrucosa]